MSKKEAANQDVVKDDSMLKQKVMMAAHYDRLTEAPAAGHKVCSTFVPGNLNELVMCFDLLNNLPEINAIQNGLRKQSGEYVREAERIGHSEDVCTYVKSDIGMIAMGNLAPNGKPLPDPDVLLLSYTGCFTFMKWFELLREQYGCETIMLHTPYQADGKITQNMRDYMVKQLKEEVIPKLEKISGVKFDIDRLREYLAASAKAEEDLSGSWKAPSTAPRRSTPISVAFITSGRSSAPFAARKRRPTTTTPCVRKCSSGSPTVWVRSRRKAISARRNTAWWSRGRPTTPAFATSGKCSTTKARWSSPVPTPRSAGSTISAFATTQPTRWKRWPITAWGSTPTAACRSESRCCRPMSRNTRRTGC